jgi:hypothetical protein
MLCGQLDVMTHGGSEALVCVQMGRGVRCVVRWLVGGSVEVLCCAVWRSPQHTHMCINNRWQGGDHAC